MKWLQHNTITFRLTLLFALTSTLVLLLLGYLIGNSVEQHFEDLDRAVLTSQLERVQRTLNKAQSRVELTTLAQQLGSAAATNAEGGTAALFLALVADDGELLFATTGAAFPPILLAPRAPLTLRPIVWKTANQQPLRGISGLAHPSFAVFDAALPVRVALAIDTRHHEHFMQSFRVTLWSSVLLATLLSGLLGWAATRHGLSPLQAIKRQAADITAHRLNARLPVEAMPAELLGLVNTLNDMLTRLEDSFTRLSDFSSDLAHELRTPVSNLLTQTQVTLAHARDVAVYRDILASNSEEFERLSRTISDMLFLAQTENRPRITQRERIDWITEVNDLFAFYEALAEEKSVTLIGSGHGLVSGDQLMLRRALSNLLSNALRHTPNGGQVHVSVDDTEVGWVKLSVTNSGEIIPAEHLPRLFDRFYRAAPFRHAETGLGLGLAITRSIMRAHGGEAQVHSDIAGTVFELRLPVSQAHGDN